MNINGEADFYDEDGNALKQVDQTIYLGASIRKDGNHSAEISRRIGESYQSFLKLKSVWSHANISRARKIEILNACVLSKLLYSLESVVCKEIDRRKINAFHCRCLRQILRIPHSYISHVSNTEVLHHAKSRPLYQILIQRQLKFYASILKHEPNDLLRRAHFAPGNYIPKT